MKNKILHFLFEIRNILPYILFIIIVFPIMLHVCASNNVYSNVTIQKPTIITIHGAGGTGGPYEQYSKDLQTVFKEVANIYYFTYNTEQSVTVTSQALDLVLEQIETPVILIGHSQGGFTAFYCLHYCKFKNKIQQVVYLSSPLYGTQFIKSSIGCIKIPTGLDEIRWNSDLQQRLKDLDRCPNNIKCYAYAGDNDPFLKPKETAYLKSDNTFIYPGNHDTTLQLIVIKDFYKKLGI